MKPISFFSLVLFLAACAVLGADRSSAFKNVGADEFSKLLADTNSVVLDVRTPAEFASGHLKKAVNIDWNGDDFAKQITELNKSKTYLIYCASGNRSARASTKMSELGFNRLYNLQGGIRAWQRAGQLIDK